MGIKDIFNQFLEDNNCKEQYYNNAEAAPDYAEDLIYGAFIWDKSPEGLDYWIKIDKK